MDARLPSSTKWTRFPKEFTEQIIEIFQTNYGERIGDARFYAEGRIYPQEVALRVGYLPKGRLRQNNFEASLDHNPKTLNADEMILKLVDILGAFLESYLEMDQTDEEMDLPRTWQKHKFGELNAYLRYTTVNTDLEAEADRLLGLKDESLVADAEEASEDALDKASMKLKITKKD